MKKIIFYFILVTILQLKSPFPNLLVNSLQAQNTPVQFADYYPMAVGNLFVYLCDDYILPDIKYRYYISKDTVFYNHRYFKFIRSTDYISGYDLGWFRFDSTSANLLVYSPGNGCSNYANDKIIDSLASKINNHCDGCIYQVFSTRFVTDTNNMTYFNQNVKTKMFHHDGLMLENKRYAKGFGVVYFEGGEPFISSSNTITGCRINGVYYGDTTLTSINLISSNIPDKFSLYQNYPNPFNPTTKIRFDLSAPTLTKGGQGGVSLKIFDILGREVQTLVNEKLQPGSYEIEWNASQFPSGVYFYKLISDNYIDTKKMLMIK